MITGKNSKLSEVEFVVVHPRNVCGFLLVSGLLTALPQDHKPSELVGTWRGTSTCTDRAAAPACSDEVVVYEFTAGPKPGTVTWKADKVVDGKRQPMGEMEMSYDAGQECWSAEFRSPRIHSVWCLVIDGSHLTGTGRLLPGKETVRKIDVQKER